MSEDPEVQIKYAKLRDGSEIGVDEASALGSKEFYCAGCSEKLNFRQGDVRIHHFAHKKRGDVDCILRTKEGVRQQNREATEHPESLRKHRGEASLLLSIKSGTPTFYLKLLHPKGKTLKVNEIEEMIGKMTVDKHDESADYSINRVIPNEGDILVYVSATTDEYEVDIKGLDVEDYPLKQCTKGICEGDIFTGTEYAERQKRITIDIGETIYVVGKEGEYKTNIGFYISKIEVTEENKDDLIKKYEAEEKLTNNRFVTDVILPPFVNPSEKKASFGSPSKDVLIATSPQSVSSRFCPCFEMIALYGDEGKKRTEGDITFFTTKTPILGEINLFSIHWHSSHKEFEIHSEEKEKQEYLGESLSFILRMESTDRNVLPGEEITADAKILDDLETHLIPNFPSNIKVNMRWTADAEWTEKIPIGEMASKAKDYRNIAKKLELWLDRHPKITLNFRRPQPNSSGGRS